MSKRRLLVWDSSALLHPARADRVDVLADLAKPWENVTTAAVLAELDNQGGLAESLLAPGWVREEHVDGLEELSALVRWGLRVGMTERHNRGEATVLAWAEAHGGVALLDDSDARQVGKVHGLEVHGTLWLCAEAVKDGRVSEAGLAGFLGCPS